MTESTEGVLHLFNEIQTEVERDKALLARELHDQLGSLLLAASMDASVLEKRLEPLGDATLQKMQRLRSTLAKAVDLTRKITEELRPTLLDTFGLVTALRWQFKENCLRANIRCTVDFPEQEITLDPDVSIALFRVAQEALGIAFGHQAVKTVHFILRMEESALTIQLTDDGLCESPQKPHRRALRYLSSLQHRVSALGGELGLQRLLSRGTMITARIPLSLPTAIH